MKKLILLPALFAAALVISITACQKESDVLPTVSEGTDGNAATDRTIYTPVDPCGNRKTVGLYNLAGKDAIEHTAFQPKWKWGELDRIANDCVLGGTFPGNCADGGMAVFYGVEALNFSNFPDPASPAVQDQIIAIALAHAAANINTCGANYTPTIYQIDFTTFPSGPFWGYEFQFAVRYVCCPGGVGE